MYVARTDFHLQNRVPPGPQISNSQLEKPWTSQLQLFPTGWFNQYRTLNQHRASFRATPSHNSTVHSLGSLDRSLHRTSLPVDVEFVIHSLSNFILQASAAIYGSNSDLQIGSALLLTADPSIDTFDCTRILCWAFYHLHLQATLRHSKTRSQDSSQGH